ncbi:MAG: helix-hairpin-helix domain-containing protein [Spirosomaceae bacterium]|jgi:DNA uptake protein ComE-like DNA-binding protein|nr:helix-hairpin-helix domain-containing protein [Spirosomataceae bacterium]
MLSKILLTIRDEFGLSRAQARGFLALAGLMVAFWFGPLVFDRLFSKADDTITAADSHTADSLLTVLEAVQPQRNFSNNPNFPNNSNFETVNPERPLAMFYFDPNTASAAQLQELGMPKFIAERIVKYRSKGGQFRQKEDLQKIYGLQPTLYERLEPYISIAVTASNSPNVSTTPNLSNTPNNPNFPNSLNNKTSKPTVFDINTADTTQLIRLRGIGSKLAARIVKFRDGLGGFASEAQFGEVFGLDSLALSELNRYAQVRTPARKISINTASPDDLDRHPYLSRRQAEIIVRYREQHGAYSSPQDLLKIKILDEKLVNKIAPYLAF